MIAESTKRKLAKALQQMAENTLTRTVIIPLLERLGYKRVEFFGGTSEHGKDIVFWEAEKLGGDRLLVAQVKHFKLTKSASDSKSFQNVVNQLLASFKDDLYGTDQFPYPPSEAFLITTYEIDVAVLQTRLGRYSDLKNKVKIIDGIQLAELLINHYPEFAEKKMGVSMEIKTRLGDYLNNEILLKAIGFNKTKDLKVIYTDIDFSVGRQSTELFFGTDFYTEDIVYEFNESNLLTLQQDIEVLKKEFSTDFIKVNLGQINKKYQHTLAKNTDIEIQKEKLKQQLERLQPIQMSDSVKKRNEVNNEINRLNIKIAQLNADIDHFRANIPIYGSIIAKQIKEKRDWIEGQVTLFNTRKPTTSALKSFIKRSGQIIEASAIFFSRDYFSNSLGVDSNTKYRKDHVTTRFKLPIGQVFDTGENIIVLGEAGAGKSTSVQMYALNAAELDDPLVICIPLANTMQNWQKVDMELTDEERSLRLDIGITRYLNYKGIKITPDEFNGYLKTRKIVLLLDGLDEAVKPSPWLPRAIVQLSIKYPNSQIVVTSRVSGGYLEEIPFFAVTLLPFTSKQRSSFIKKWFETGEEPYAELVRTHLRNNPDLAEIASSPLLLTTLCVLARNQVALPFTEIRLYDDRIKLLTGYYDRVKNILQRLDTTPQVLEMVARKLAFHLHSNNKREEFREVLQDTAVRLCIEPHTTRRSQTCCVRTD